MTSERNPPELTSGWAEALTTFAANGTTASVKTMAANVQFMPLSASARIPENTARVKREVGVGRKNIERGRTGPGKIFRDLNGGLDFVEP